MIRNIEEEKINCLCDLIPPELLDCIMRCHLYSMSLFSQLNTFWYEKTKPVIKGIFFIKFLYHILTKRIYSW